MYYKNWPKLLHKGLILSVFGVFALFFSDNNTRCTVLEEFVSPEGVFEHVKANAALLEQMSKLGGKIEGNIFPIDQEGTALKEIRSNWDSRFHNYFLGKN